VYGNKVLRRKCGSARDELLSEELHNLYSSPSIIRMMRSRRMRWVRHVARMGRKTNACRVLVGRTEGKTPLGRPRRRWVNNVKMDLGEIGWGCYGLDWFGSGQG
jgi:hypothetical protein